MTRRDPRAGTRVEALLLDLDHTLFDPATIPADVLEPVYARLRETGRRIPGVDEEALEMAIEAFARTPITELARRYRWPDAFLDVCWDAAASVELPSKLEGYPDVPAVVALPQRKILVTTGLPRVQLQKVSSLGFDAWLESVHVDDVRAVPRVGKRGVFASILADTGLAPGAVLVVGDRLESEIAAGIALGLETVHVHRGGCDGRCPATHCIEDLRGLAGVLAGPSADRAHADTPEGTGSHQEGAP